MAHSRVLMTELKKSLRLVDGLAMVVGITVGSGIFRTPGLVAARLGRPGLTFVAWMLGAGLALLGALCFAELTTRLPRAGGKYVYIREAFGRRGAFVVGVMESLAINGAAIAAIGVAAGEFLIRLAGWSPGLAQAVGAGFVALFTAINLLGVQSGRWVQNVVTSAKILALGGVVVMAFARGTGAGWHGALAEAPHGWAVWGALAAASPAVIWTYYGYPDLAKIAEEVVDPGRTLPRLFLGGLAIVATLYLLLNAAFLQVLPIEQIAASKLVAADVATAILGASGGAVVAALALLVVLASLNGNVFVTPRVLFGLARDRLAPARLAEVNAGGTPWVAMLLVGAVAIALATTGTFEWLIGLAIVWILVIDGWAVLALFRLRRREPIAPFRVPLYPWVPLALFAVYGALFVGTAVAQPMLIVQALAVLAGAYGLSWTVDSAAP
ncbi:MAG TPA: amino acid permease [Gemmatimonadales bacterium]|nr:amino acid permease [Gemmatimonadales bacterium]